MATKPEFQDRLASIDELITRIEDIADPALQASARQLVELVMELHGSALERILETLQAGGEPGQHWIQKLGSDDLVSSLLILHGLHPESLEDRVKRAIDKVRPSLQKRGGEVEILGIENDIPRLRLRANGHTAALAEVVEGAVYQAAPDIKSLVIDVPDDHAGFVPLEMLRSAADALSREWPRARPHLQGDSVSELAGSGAFEKLRSFARPAPALERCEMCSTPLAREHQHLMELAARKLICACDSCAILFTSQTKYKRVPRRVRNLEDFQLTDSQWDGMLMPINLAFFFHSTPKGRVIAMYPSPAGATESLLPLETWEEIVNDNPVLHEMQSDVEALLVNRIGHSRGFTHPEHYLAPIDECYKLVGLIRGNWQGLSGGTEVWQQIAEFFAQLRLRSSPATVVKADVPSQIPVSAGSHA